MRNLRHDIQEVISEGSAIAARAIVTGTMDGDFAGVAAKGRSFRVDQGLLLVWRTERSSRPGRSWIPRACCPTRSDSHLIEILPARRGSAIEPSRSPAHSCPLGWARACCSPSSGSCTTGRLILDSSLLPLGPVRLQTIGQLRGAAQGDAVPPSISSGVIPKRSRTTRRMNSAGKKRSFRHSRNFVGTSGHASSGHGFFIGVPD